ncbi:hypothetical protein LCM10_03830 [Rossellomorea aquimaris]|uniref:hypothetical protein n=1 Tax=Rossellomorea aquimaris TaxID=189382 RepID=UPI001CD4543E|nr:hypothetical protein [Rossellomorea aquimaris]MCA1054105.1 hypothetical protein [Rossellomorea aquimaris]
MNILSTCAFTLCLLFTQICPASAQGIEYGANQQKSFPSADAIYNGLDKNLYREYDHATYSVRKKMLYKDVPEAFQVFEKKTGNYVGQSQKPLNKHIHPERQVYFLASFYQSHQKEYRKHIVLDAETLNQLESGKGFSTYEDPHEE